MGALGRVWTKGQSRACELPLEMAVRCECCRRPDEHMAAAGAGFGRVLLLASRHVLSATRYHGWLDDGRCNRFELCRRGLHHRNGANWFTTASKLRNEKSVTNTKTSKRRPRG